MKNLIRLSLIVVLIAFLVAACTPAPPEVVTEIIEVEREVTRVVEGETIVETIVEQVEVTRVVQVEVEVERPPTTDRARSEQLNIAIGGPIADPTNLNLYAPGVSRSNTGLHQIVYEYFFYNNLQTGEFVPWLATDFEYNSDFTALTVSLREGVAWNDGAPFTADDVVFTYDLLRGNPGMVWAEEANKQVARVEKVDDLTVIFHLNESNPRLHLNREAFPAVGIWGGITILPKHVWEGQDPLTFKSSPPVATGPYKLANASSSVISWERRDDWWGTEVFGITPAPRFVNFQHVGTSTSVALALAADDLDSPNIGILSLADFLAVKDRNPNLRAWFDSEPYAWLDPCPRALMVQNANAPWDQKEARWALSFMIDRAQIVDLAYQGTTLTAWGIWPDYDGLRPYFNAISDLRQQYPSDTRDLARAEELLTSIGMSKNADGYWTTAAGQVLEVNYLVNADSGEEMRVAVVLGDQLEAAGIRVQQQPLGGGVLSDTILRGDYDIKLHSMCPGFIFDNLELFHSKFFVELGEPAPWFERNSFRYRNEAFDTIVDEMGRTPPDDTAALQRQFQEAMAIWLDELPVVPVVQAPALVPFSSRYWEGWPTGDDAWNMPVSWWATFNLVINGYPSPTTGEWVGGIRPAGGTQ
jgi:peptide/nickel transport system substrate-binding protein